MFLCRLQAKNQLAATYRPYSVCVPNSQGPCLLAFERIQATGGIYSLGLTRQHPCKTTPHFNKLGGAGVKLSAGIIADPAADLCAGLCRSRNPGTETGEYWRNSALQLCMYIHVRSNVHYAVNFSQPLLYFGLMIRRDDGQRPRRSASLLGLVTGWY